MVAYSQLPGSLWNEVGDLYGVSRLDLATSANIDACRNRVVSARYRTRPPILIPPATLAGLATRMRCVKLNADLLKLGECEFPPVRNNQVAIGFVPYDVVSTALA